MMMSPINKLLFPCKYIGITSGYKTASRPTHAGVDLGWNRSYGGPNHEIISPVSGKVTEIRSTVADGTGTGYGNYLAIQADYDKRITVIVAHLKHNSIKVKKGDSVTQGQLLAIMGNTGNSTGVHCHYEVKINNVKKNPLLYTYATPDVVIAASTKSNYKILELNTSSYQDIKGVNQNVAVNQLQVKANNLRVRSTPALSENNQVGWAITNAYYNYYETASADGYIWYKIGDNQWIAYKDTWVNLYPSDSKEEQIGNLQKKVNELTNEIISLKEEIEGLNIKLQEASFVKFTYNVLMDSDYQIKLNNGETLLIK